MVQKTTRCEGAACTPRLVKSSRWLLRGVWGLSDRDCCGRKWLCEESRRSFILRCFVPSTSITVEVHHKGNYLVRILFQRKTWVVLHFPSRCLSRLRLTVVALPASQILRWRAQYQDGLAWVTVSCSCIRHNNSGI